ncbi:MAG: abortive infection system antitoxin AbiGi family protein [Dehalococcoidales bacterium]|nr:abortive infection system antitoxin AbiGi family protein [Dehalococcoidales bacterium]
MSTLSPNTLFHFTNSLNNLLGILDNTFYPRYCYEEFDLIDNDQQHFIHDAFPMVCFCDIPLSLLINHIERYGQYGLGMTKQWGISKGLNPVIYFNRNSHLARNYSVLTNELLLSIDPTGQAFHETMGYVKPYEGTLYREGKTIAHNVRFYDEHEWRYLPNAKVLADSGIIGFMQHHQYMNTVSLADANRRLETNATRLSFEADDIKYVIVREENEIDQMIEDLRNIKGNIHGYDEKTVDRLVSHIITVDQIKSDF